MMNNMILSVYSKSDVGKKRSTNQDSVITKLISDNLALAVVCDGMGGTNGGDVASKMAVEIIENELKDKINDTLQGEDVRHVMYEAIHLANDEIYKKSKEDENLEKMGTTIVMCVVIGSDAYFMYVGDSRAYVVDNDVISQISVDHSIVQNMIDIGEITPEEAYSHPQRNIITRALGVAPSVEIDYKTLKVYKGDKILLCSDGLSNSLSSMEMYGIFEDNPVENVPKILIDKSNAKGGNDNITVAIIDCK